MNSVSQRVEIIDLVDEAVLGEARYESVCEVVGIAAGTLRRWRPGHGSVQSYKRPTADREPLANRLTENEQRCILETGNRREFANSPPSQIVPILADRSQYIGSEATIYRVLKREGQLSHRGREKKRQPKKPPLTQLTDAINQMKSQFFYLYMVEDLFSRFGVHWEVFEEENSEHTCKVIEQSMWREKCLLTPPVLHRDNGSVLKSQTVMQKLHDLGISSSHFRPRVSNDNAFVESLFRTLKYCPSWPSQGFENLQAAREWANAFMSWYNEEHRHSALKFVTPAQRHNGEDIKLLEERKALYERAKAAHPERWSGNTRDWSRKNTMSLNPEKKVESVA